MAARPDVAAVVLAAGQGTRMRSERAKVLHQVAGRSLLGHALQALRPLGLGQVVVVVGHQGEAVAKEAAAADLDGLTTVNQEDQLGTGHAVEQALPALAPGIRRVLVLPGDAPLLSAATLETLLDAGGGPLTLLTATPEDPGDYGRILRDGGAVVAIVEEADADPDQRRLQEVNAGVYAFDRAVLERVVGTLEADNAQGERYLTDAVGSLVADGGRVGTVAAPPEEALGVNDRVQMAAAGRLLRQRVLEALMRDGVTVVDPAATWIDVGVTVGRDAVVLPGCVLQGRTDIGAGTSIGPGSHLIDATVGEGARVVQSVVRGAVVGPGATVGPFTYLRRGTRLAEGARAGAFVEIKNATVGPASKVPHLSYVGDATIGRDVNIGAGTITCNYDGFAKHETVIEDGAFIGSDTMLVAPVRVGAGAVTGASSAITRDVPADALAVERTEQATVEGWARARRERNAR